MSSVALPSDPAPATRWQVPRISTNDRWIGGVAAAIATELGVQPLMIRISFAVLTLAGGWGLALYAVSWLLLAVGQPRQISPYRAVPKGATALHRNVAVAMIVVGLLLLLRNLGFGFVDGLVIPTGFVVIGFLIAWTRHQHEGGLSAVVRILAGVVVGVGGMIGFLAIRANVVDALLVLTVALAVVLGIGLVATPSLARIGHDLDRERQERVRADERARVAAHLHDSVLQTLALIQRHAGDPVRTAQLARQQERELRHWLYDDRRPTTADAVRLGTVLEQVAAEVDAAHGVPVKVIVVGDDQDLDRASIEPLVAATREAAVNGAKHSGARRIDVFAERLTDRVEVFVRDTGRGFDPDRTPGDRRGISGSIIGRMARAGGSAAVHSTPGEGTEVELVLPLDRAVDDDAPSREADTGNGSLFPQPQSEDVS